MGKRKEKREKRKTQTAGEITHQGAASFSLRDSLIADSCPRAAAAPTAPFSLFSFLFSLCTFLFSLSPSFAAEVNLEVSTHETYINIPVTIEITIKNAKSHEPPKLPDIAGATVRGPGRPSRNQSTFISGGKVTRKETLTYTFSVTPHREGRIEIPAIAVQADGKTYRTVPQVILVTESETSDLLFVDVYADKEAVYVGDSLTIKLQMWLRPYRSARYQLDQNEMWRTIRLPESSWGPFAELIQNPSKSVRVRSAFRTDSDGNERAYFVYELEKKIWAERAGQVDPGDILVLVNYPEAIGRVRDPFSIGFLSTRRMGVTKSKPIAARPLVAPIDIKPIPTQDRPAHYSGAVGKYNLRVTAKPVAVAVGDPITLTMTIRGTGRLNTLQPPPLLDWTELTDAFKLPADPIAGIVQGRRKEFTQSIRPRNENVSEIPAIPFSYFDPLTEQFVTVHSKPIPITVRAVDTMSIADVVGGEGGGPGATELKEHSGGILANYTGMNEVLSYQAFAPGVGSTAAISLPPMLFFAYLVVQRRRQRSLRDPRAARRRSAYRRAMAGIRSAGERTEADIAKLLAATVSGYIADRCDLPSGGLTRADALEQLRQRQAPDEIIEQVDDLLEICESLKFAGMTPSAGQNLAAQATECINQLERHKL